MPPIEVHRFFTLAEMPASIAELFNDTEKIYPEFSAGWFENLHNSVFHDDPTVRYYVAERSGRPVAMLPVHLTRTKLVQRVEALSNYYTSLYSPILADDASKHDLTVLLDTISRDYRGVHEMRFAPMDPESSAYSALLAALRACGWMPFRYFCFGNWHQQVEGDWQSYLAKRPGELRSTIRRKGKKFAADGGTFEIVIQQEKIEAAIADFNHVYGRSWKKPEPYPEFIPGLIRWLAAKGWLRLGIARLHGQPIAAQLWIVSHGRAYIFKLAYDEAFAHYASGTLLSAHMMEYVIDRDHVHEIDYLIGDDPYKKQWMHSRRERWGIVAYRPTTLVGLLLLSKELAGRTLRKATQITRLYTIHNASSIRF